MRVIVHKSEPEPSRIAKVIVTNNGGHPRTIGDAVEHALRGREPVIGGIEVIREPESPAEPTTVDIVGIPYETARVLRELVGSVAGSGEERKAANAVYSALSAAGVPRPERRAYGELRF